MYTILDLGEWNLRKEKKIIVERREAAVHVHVLPLLSDQPTPGSPRGNYCMPQLKMSSLFHSVFV